MEIQVEKEPDVELHDENVLHDVVEYSRSKQVLNEEQTLAVLLVYTTGLLPDHSDYGSAYITGGSSGGKTHLKEKVVDKLFALKKEWLFNTTAGSDKSLIDHPEWDDCRVAALNELNKIPDEMLEFLKSVHGDDGGFNYSRNVSDPEAESGRTSVDISREPKPVIFMLADENKMEVEAELQTRMLEIKVDETEEKNAAVHDMHWGHENLTLPASDTEYIFDAPKLQYALQYHISNIPVDTPVLIPTGQGRFDGDDWDAANVTRPMFTFKRSESTRASRMIASMVKASALLNYHSRETVTVEVEGEAVEHLVAEPVDVGNAIAMRKTLMTSTHGLDEKKLAILDAIIERGAQMDSESTALACNLKSIEEEIQDNPNIATIQKKELRSLLDDMNEMYLIDITENPNDRRENLYVYDGGNALGRPNIEDEWEHFQDVVDPIHHRPIKDTVDKQQERLGARSVSDALEAAQHVPDGQKSLEGDAVPDAPESLGEAAESLTEVESDVLALMRENLNGRDVCHDDLDDMDYEHMIIGREKGLIEEGADDCLRPVRPASTDDIRGTIFDPQDPRWNGHNRGEVKAKIEQAVGSLSSKGLWHMEENGDASVTIVVRNV